MDETLDTPFANTPSDKPRRSWLNTATSVSALLVATGTVLGVCLHLSGHVAHITQLRDFGIPSDLFPHAVDWTMINGYYAVFTEWARILKHLPWRVLVFTCLLLTLAIWIYRLPVRKRRAGWVNRLPTWLKNIVDALFVSAISIAAVSYLLTLVSLIAIIPAYIGERAGHHAAQEMLASYRSTHPMVPQDEIWQDNKLFIRGHVIAVSDDTIAIYDTQAKQVRIIKRGDMELRTRPCSLASTRHSKDTCPGSSDPAE